MIIYQVDVLRAAIFKTENKSPVTRNAHCPKVFEIAPQSVQPVARQIKALRPCRGIEQTEYATYSRNLVSFEVASCFPLVKSLQAAMPDTDYHCDPSCNASIGACQACGFQLHILEAIINGSFPAASRYRSADFSFWVVTRIFPERSQPRKRGDDTYSAILRAATANNGKGFSASFRA